MQEKMNELKAKINTDIIAENDKGEKLYFLSIPKETTIGELKTILKSNIMVHQISTIGIHTKGISDNTLVYGNWRKSSNTHIYAIREYQINVLNLKQ